MAEEAGIPALTAQAALAAGKTAAARGGFEAATERFESGLAAIADGRPLLRAALHFELARVHETNAPAEAAVNAEAAFRIYRRLGAPEATTMAELLRALGRHVSAEPTRATPLDVLTRREREVLDLLAFGLTNSDIARRLYITPKTAEHHVSSILSKLGLRNRAEAAAFAASFRLGEEVRVGN